MQLDLSKLPIVKTCATLRVNAWGRCEQGANDVRLDAYLYENFRDAARTIE